MKNKRAIILLFIAHIISSSAIGISLLSIPWYYAMKGEQVFFNLIYASATFLTLFWGLFAGTLIDRFNRRNIFLYTNIIEGMIVGSVAITGLWMQEMPILLPALVLSATFFGFNIYYPNLFAFVQQIVEPEHFSKVTSWIEIMGQATNVFAGAMAAVLLEGLDYTLFDIHILIPRVNIWDIFVADGLTYLLSFLIIINIRYVTVNPVDIELGTLKNRLKSGFRYLKEHKYFFLFGLFSYALFAVVLVDVFSLLASIVKDFIKGKADVYGIAELLFAGGALSAGIFIRRLMTGKNEVLLLIILISSTATLFLFSGLIPSVYVLYLKSMVFGFSNSSARIIRLTYIMRRVGTNIVGRVNSIFNMINVLARSVFILAFSASFFHVDGNVSYTYIIISVFLFLCVIGLIKLRKKVI